jgi:hypothetical protein
MSRTKLLSSVAVAAALALPAAALGAGSGGVTAPHFYVDGALYRTVGTPTDFSGTGAPNSSFETLYDFGGLQPNVVSAGPGEPGFRGGRWQVRPLMFNTSYAATVAAHDTNGSGNLDSNAEVQAALADSGPGGATLGPVVQEFECPVIPVPPSRN